MHVFAIRFLPLVAALFVMTAGAARADMASDLVSKNLLARGGAEKLAAISTIEFTGKIVQPGGSQLTYKAIRARKNGGTLIQSSIQGLTLVQGYDGTVGWRINPFEGRRDAERISDDATRALADEASIDGALLSANARGSTITYLGREDFDGTDAYKLRVVGAGLGAAQYVYYLDPETYLEIRVEETRVLRGSKRVSLSELSDYERVDGVYFPFSIETGGIGSFSANRQKLVIDTARANVPVSDSLFAIPAAPGAKL